MSFSLSKSHNMTLQLNLQLDISSAKDSGGPIYSQKCEKNYHYLVTRRPVNDYVTCFLTFVLFFVCFLTHALLTLRKLSC